MSHYGVDGGEEDGGVTDGDPVPVALDELLAEGLFGGELLGTDDGLEDLAGLGLPLGLGAGGFTARLGVGVGVCRGLCLTWCVCVAAGELRCCAVLASTYPLPCPEMFPVR